MIKTNIKDDVVFLSSRLGELKLNIDSYDLPEKSKHSDHEHEFIDIQVTNPYVIKVEKVEPNHTYIIKGRGITGMSNIRVFLREDPTQYQEFKVFAFNTLDQLEDFKKTYLHEDIEPKEVIHPTDIECPDVIRLYVGQTVHFNINVLPKNANNRKFYTALKVTLQNRSLGRVTNNSITGMYDGVTKLVIKTDDFNPETKKPYVEKEVTVVVANPSYLKNNTDLYMDPLSYEQTGAKNSSQVGVLYGDDIQRLFPPNSPTKNEEKA